jgi:dual-specificity kinase
MMESVCGSKIDAKLVKQVVQGRGNNQNQAAKYVLGPNSIPMSTDQGRYFNRSKLDYPNEETTRASRKYVKAMKQLHVSADSCLSQMPY